ncbi:MAG: hypothetical protein E7374_00985 [Clostridiales bacterium]|nr:hypothetical protein [Clostridiales bacterium]
MKNKTKYNLSIIMLAFSIILFVASIILTSYFHQHWWTILISSLLFITSIVLTFYFYIRFTEFKCSKCDTTFKPKAVSVIFSIHTISHRLFRCPECHKFSWCEDKFIDD